MGWFPAFFLFFVCLFVCFLHSAQKPDSPHHHRSPLFPLFSLIATLWALLQLEQTIYAPLGALLIGSQLNSQVDGTCRIAFYAKVIQVLSPKKEDLSVLRVFKPKQRTAMVDRVVNEREVIGTNLTEKGGNISAVGLGRKEGSNLVRGVGCGDEERIEGTNRSAFWKVWEVQGGVLGGASFGEE